ncbi:unnamed protein product [Diatraea saccharalis]|uniref:RRM domain-containing protein n=1 Tax=Diatraea saccharalis TaxID=40085 RepID=A0A9N9R863_9NEOP|nr:unnamed protein product [Diatraea saccharalis]
MLKISFIMKPSEGQLRLRGKIYLMLGSVEEEGGSFPPQAAYAKCAMCERYPGYLFGGTPVSSWDRSFNSLENQIQHQYRGRLGSGARYWGSMSEGGGVSAAGDSCKTNLIVNYLPQSMTEKDLYAMFMTIGPIESCRVMKDFKTGYSYGFGFVNFTREEDAARAIETFNGYQLRNKRFKVGFMTFYFYIFDKREEAQEAIAALNNVIPEGGTEPLSVKRCGAETAGRGGAAAARARLRLHSDTMVAEEHGKQKAAYYAGWAAGFHHNRGDFAWSCGSCMVTDPWDNFPSPTMGGSHPTTPRNGCRPGNCANRVAYPNYLPEVGTHIGPRASTRGSKTKDAGVGRRRIGRCRCDRRVFYPGV